MNIDRREFLASATIGVTSLLLPGGVFAQTDFDHRTVLTRDDFAARNKDWFYLHNADASHQGNLQLFKLIDESSSSRVQQFVLSLRSERQALIMPSGFYEVAGEPFSLFVKHTHEQGGRQFYRAEFALLQ